MSLAGPRQFDKWAVLDGIGWNPHRGQLLIAESKARHRVASCGRRFGKSDVGGHELVPEALMTRLLKDKLKREMKRREFWIVGPEYSDSEKEFRVLWNELTRLEVPMDHPGSYNDPIGGNMHISLWDGAFQVHAKSAKYPATLVGEGLSGVIMAEAAKMKQLVWVKYIRPTLADFNGWSLHTSTPEGKNHFYDLWQQGRDPGNPDWASFRMPSWINPYVYKTPTKLKDVKRLQEMMASDFIKNMMDDAKGDMDEEIRRVGILQTICRKYDLAVDPEILDLMSSMSMPSFNQEIGAEFTDFVGRVFKDFDEEIHVGDLRYEPGWPTFAAVDYGYRNPNVWLVIQVGPFGEINVLRELYVREHTTVEFAHEIKARGLDKGVQAIYPDPSDPDNSNILMDELNIPWRAHTGGDLNHRLDAIRRALKEWNTHVPRGFKSDGVRSDRRPQIMWDRSCTMSIYEMNEYRYPEEKELNSVPGQEKPLKKDDHSPEALGRFFAGHFSTPQEDAGPSRVTRAQIG
ncbi:terminase [Gordonia phage LittleFella]|nr:terminase [Gordonia phage LittleFella]